MGVNRNWHRIDKQTKTKKETNGVTKAQGHKVRENSLAHLAPVLRPNSRL